MKLYLSWPAAPQVEKTPGLLLEKAVLLQQYTEQGWQMVATGFKPFFPSLSSVSENDVSHLKSEFCSKAITIGRGMMNAEGLVADKHTNLWVTAVANRL